MRCVLCCVRLYNRFLYKPIPKPVQPVSVSSLPWLWIGAEFYDGTKEGYTTVVNEVLEPGDVVTPTFLTNLTQAMDVKRWIYLNAKTFAEDEIPAEGIVIENDSDQ